MEADLKEQFDIQKEMLELSIKAGRRMMHDYKHLLNEVPNNNKAKIMYEERGEMWESIFYPDDGMKNYRANIHREMDRLEFQVHRLTELLKKNNIDHSEELPY